MNSLNSKITKNENSHEQGIELDVVPGEVVTSTATSDLVQTITEFHDAAEREQIDFAYNEQNLDPFSLSGLAPTDLAEFLSRPVLVDSREWVQGSDLSVFLNPLALFLDNVHVRKKVENYSLIRFKMCIRVMVNGNPFHQGRLGVFYSPMSGTSGRTPLSTDDIYYFSALPGTRSSPLNPATNEVFEGCFPFIFPSPFYPLGEVYSASLGARYTDYSQLRLVSYGDLLIANGDVGQNASITTYVWLEDVELSVSTGATFVAGKKSSKSISSRAKNNPTRAIPQPYDDEEEENGIVSGITSAFASAFGELDQVPLIGPYAAIGSDFLNKSTRALRIFGFSRPNVNTDPSFMRINPFSNTAQTMGADTSEKLSMDPKQALSLDPSMNGLGPADAMSFAHIVQHWGLLGHGVWNVGDPIDTRIYQIGVSPWVTTTRTVNTDTLVQMQPVALPSTYMKYWSGTIEYKVVIASSQFHRGRLTISWDPLGTNLGVSSSNVRSSWVVDLSKTSEFYFSVSWGQADAYRVTTDSTTQLTHSPTGIIYNPDFMNGSIDIRVSNILTVADPTNSVDVWIFARGGPDLEFAGPHNGISNKLSSVPSGLASGSAWPFGVHNPAIGLQPIGPSFCAEPAQPGRLFGEPNENVGLKPTAFFGERVVSFRTFCKRFVHVTSGHSSIATTADDSIMFEFPMSAFPPPYSPYLEPTIHQINGTSSFVTNHPINILRMCYVLWKGGIRWKVGFAQRQMTPLTYTAVRNPESFSGYTPVISTLTLPASGYDAVTNNRGPAGLVVSTSNRNTIEYEVPFYSKYKWASTNFYDISPNTTTFVSGLEEDCMGSKVIVAGACNSTSASVFTDWYVATGEDFDFQFFLTVPPFVALP